MLLAPVRQVYNRPCASHNVYYVKLCMDWSRWLSRPRVNGQSLGNLDGPFPSKRPCMPGFLTDLAPQEPEYPLDDLSNVSHHGMSVGYAASLSRVP